jgi:hypothetical protein
MIQRQLYLVLPWAQLSINISSLILNNGNPPSFQLEKPQDDGQYPKYH